MDIQVPENEWTDDKGAGKDEDDKRGINTRLKQAGSSWIGSIRAAKSCSFLLFKKRGSGIFRGRGYLKRKDPRDHTFLKGRKG